MKQLPNAITVVRIVLSFILLFLVRQPLAYVVVYFCCGLSDIADGFIARKYKAETTLGAKLDSLADFIFTAVNLYVLIKSVHLENEVTALFVIAVVAVIRIINFVMTKRKFKQWGIIHTIANKAAGVALFISLPFCIWANGFPIWLVIPVGIVAAASAIEESVILITTDKYDANRMSFFTK